MENVLNHYWINITDNNKDVIGIMTIPITSFQF